MYHCMLILSQSLLPVEWRDWFPYSWEPDFHNVEQYYSGRVPLAGAISSRMCALHVYLRDDAWHATDADAYGLWYNEP
jgi:hypothetical protein